MINNYLLIDVLNLVFRVFHSTSKWQKIDTEEKQLASIDLFVHAILKNILGKRTLLGQKPEDFIPFENIILAFDSYSWRRDFLRNDDTIEMSDEDYKSGRTQKNRTVIKAITKRLEEISKNIGLKVVKVDKFEADDIIGLFPTLDNKHNPENRYIVLSNDGDFGQLTKNPNVLVFNPNKDAFNKQDGTVALTIKTLIGDTSDSIENPFFGLVLDEEEVTIKYGEGTVLKGINGKFSSTTPDNKRLTIQHHNGTLELFAENGEHKETIYLSEKVKIEFDEDFNLSNDLKLKFEKGTSEDEIERKNEEVNAFLSELIKHSDSPFCLHDNHKEDLTKNLITALVEKFEKEHLKWVKKTYETLSMEEKKEKSRLFWIDDLIVWNKKLMKDLKPQTKEELIAALSTVFRKNLERNYVLIDFNNIPEELQKHFKDEVYPEILTPTKITSEERVKYLKEQKLNQISSLLEKEKNPKKR